MTSRIRLSSVGLVAVFLGFVLAVALPVWAQNTTIGIAVVVEPEAPYFGSSADFMITVEASGGAVSDVAVQVQHDCDTSSGPIEVIGNGDDILEPGEQWEYTCHTDFVVHGALYVTVTGVDSVGGDVGEELMFDCGAPFPFSIEVATSTPEVFGGEEVTWEVLVGNDGPYSLINVDGRARLNGSGPYSRMAGPVEKSGNGDDILDPGELWEYHWSAALWQDSYVAVSINGDPEHSPGTHIGSHAESDVVTVLASTSTGDTTIGLTVVVEPEAPYFGASADFTITVEASGGAVSDVVTRIEIDCNEAIGPTVLSGNGDDVLEPGEQWEYTCHTDYVFQGFVQVTVTGTDDVGGDVSESLGLVYEATSPFAVEVATSTPEVYEGAEVTWVVLVGNDGPYSLINVDSEANLNRSGEYSPMTGPVEKSGNGDDALDPGELWEYRWSAQLWQDSFVEVWIHGLPEHAPGAGVGSPVESDVVTVIAESPPPESTTVAATTTEDTLPRTGANEPLTRVGTLGFALLLFGVATLAGAAVLGKHRRQ